MVVAYTSSGGGVYIQLGWRIHPMDLYVQRAELCPIFLTRISCFCLRQFATPQPGAYQRAVVPHLQVLRGRGPHDHLQEPGAGRLLPLAQNITARKTKILKSYLKVTFSLLLSLLKHSIHYLV